MSKFKNLNLEKYIAITLIIISCCIVIWMIIPVWQNQNLNDDSFITLTYAKNLIEGNGFVYNHPPATLGTTTPMFTFAVAFLSIILPFFTVVETAILLSTIAWLSTAWLLYLLMLHLNFKHIPSAIVSVVSLLTVPGWTFFIGMEIWLFELLLVLSIYLTLKNKLVYAGMCVTALFLTRGEGALVGVILFGYLWLTQKKLSVKFSLGSAIPLSLWIFYATITFGTFLPNTLAAKRMQAKLSGGDYFITRMFTDLLPRHIDNFDIFGFWFINPYILLIVLGFVYAFRHNKPLLLFVTWGLTYLVAYTVLNPKPYYWYVLHIVFIFQLMAGVGLGWLFTVFRESQTKRMVLINSIAIIILTFTLLYPGLYLTFSHSENFFNDHRATSYKAIADWLNENSSSEESVAFIEIGYLGYFSSNQIIDLAGLIDPNITKHMIGKNGFTWGFWHYKPDYYIYAEEFDWALSDIKLAIKDYTLVYQINRNNKDNPIYIYKRN